MINRLKSTGIAALLSTALILSACGGGDDAAKDSSKTSDTEQVTDKDSDKKPSGDSGSKDGNAYVAAIAKSMTDDDEGTFLGLTDSESTCIAERFVGIIGVDHFKAAGIAPEDIVEGSENMDVALVGLDRETGYELVDSFEACGFNLREAMLESFTAEEDGMTAEGVACMEDLFNEGDFRDFMVATMILDEADMEEDPAGSAMMMGIMTCMFGEMGDMEDDS